MRWLDGPLTYIGHSGDTRENEAETETLLKSYENLKWFVFVVGDTRLEIQKHIPTAMILNKFPGPKKNMVRAGAVEPFVAVFPPNFVPDAIPFQDRAEVIINNLFL